ncbi:hypothetical protein BDP55DRAFT_131805 [Colletotrichum godetiae]|uniref:Uncharacterized protein n=1 Tax=Colletotrichum godetiae TaxID=1209918 RepID=A0AAJ0AY34_9PEZI|nr:uncharacterized protein BDP55DRAFT_131805 [Colletotrichum godetiae]KAK1700431.1 hypothetical protein BDP55DRAFT_131805 [Colletotrichum godetiae]
MLPYPSSTRRHRPAMFPPLGSRPPGQEPLPRSIWALIQPLPKALQAPPGELATSRLRRKEPSLLAHAMQRTGMRCKLAAALCTDPFPSAPPPINRPPKSRRHPPFSASGVSNESESSTKQASSDEMDGGGTRRSVPASVYVFNITGAEVAQGTVVQDKAIKTLLCSR